MTDGVACLLNRQVFNKQLLDFTHSWCQLAVMPPMQRDSDAPRPYGRQAKHKTIKSVSLESDIAQWSEAQAAAANMSYSTFIANLLESARGSSVINEASPLPMGEPVPEHTFTPDEAEILTLAERKRSLDRKLSKAAKRHPKARGTPAAEF